MTHDENLQTIWKRAAVSLEQLVAKAVAAEREACAKIADVFERHDDDQCASIHRDIAAAIRARGQ